MRALSIQQPWAWAIAQGKKPVENRTWPTAYCGPVAIHASKKPDKDALGLIASRDRYSPLVKAVAWHTRLWAPPEYVYGAILAVADLSGCHEWSECEDGAAEPDRGELRPCSPWAAKWQHHWVLGNVRRLARPVPCRGALGLWRLPDDAGKAVLRQLDEEAGDD
jgi:hypothetical protein